MNPEGRQHFTYDRATALLPEVERLLQRAMEAQQEKKRAEVGLRAYRRRLVMAGGAIPNRNRMGAMEDQARIAQQQLSAAVNHILELGVEVKDIERGLVDFPTVYRGDTVYLCYLLGEGKIAYWHGVTEGFRGRKPIDEEFLQNHVGDALT